MKRLWLILFIGFVAGILSGQPKQQAPIAIDCFSSQDAAFATKVDNAFHAKRTEIEKQFPGIRFWKTRTVTGQTCILAVTDGDESSPSIPWTLMQ